MLSGYNGALCLDPSDASINYDRGLADADRNRNDRALADVNQAIAARARITRSARR